MELLIVGELAPAKGQLDAVRALRLLRERQYDVRLVMVGSGDRRFEQRLLELTSQLDLSGHVTLAGEQSHVRPFYARTHVTVVPSHTESLSRVVIESMMLRRPVVAAAIPGNVPLLQDHRGFLFSPGSPESLAEAVQAVAMTPRDKLDALTEAACEWARSNFDPDRLVASFVDELRATARR